MNSFDIYMDCVINIELTKEKRQKSWGIKHAYALGAQTLACKFINHF